MSKPFPQGIEVLVLKAAVDPDFKQILLQQRAAAAEAIGLELTAAEATMLAAVPAAQARGDHRPRFRAAGAPQGVPWPGRRRHAGGTGRYQVGRGRRTGASKASSPGPKATQE